MYIAPPEEHLQGFLRPPWSLQIQL